MSDFRRPVALILIGWLVLFLLKALIFFYLQMFSILIDQREIICWKCGFKFSILYLFFIIQPIGVLQNFQFTFKTLVFWENKKKRFLNVQIFSRLSDKEETCLGEAVETRAQLGTEGFVYKIESACIASLLRLFMPEADTLH